MQQNVSKGTVSALYDGGKKASVTPYLGDTVTVQLVVPFFLYESLEVGMPVVYAAFEDCTGVVLARMDGEWNHKVWDGVEIVSGNTTISEGDMITSVVPSYNGHTHTSPAGDTSAPR